MDYIERSLAIQAVTRAKLPDATPEGVPIANGKRSVTDCVRRIKEIPAVQLPRWISVKERLPRMWEPVQLLFDENQAVGFWDDGVWDVYSGNGFYTEVAPNEGKPTHWMPLPEPPKEDTNAV